MAIEYLTRKWYSGRLVGYCKKNGGIVRYKLAKVEKNALTTNKRIKSTYTKCDPKFLNKEIDDLEIKVDNAVKALLYENPYLILSNSEVNKYFQAQEIKEMSKIDIFTHEFKEYIKKKAEQKHIEDVERGLDRKQHPTIKDYYSALHSVEDFELYSGVSFALEDISTTLIEQYIDFMQIDHSELEDAESGIKYVTEGGLVNKTLNKRLQCISTFIRDYYNNNEKAKIVSKCHLEENLNKEIIRLTKEELETLAELSLEDKDEERLRDYFVFLCLTGLRFADFFKLTKDNIVKSGTLSKIEIYTQKTIKYASIPLTTRAKSILDKYDADFSYFCNQVFNRKLKEMFKKYGLFENLQIKHRVIGKTVQSNNVPKRDLIASHTGRRTFISILVENGISIERIMGMTGHTSERKLKVYIDRFSTQSQEDIAPLNF